ncbi:MAG: protein TolA [Deltaproteobacteria bacterium GWA2_55_10]|nr:MAG: protein TolA [Deltaproteobacteria bacterium GWA2_55_10]
MRSGQMKSEMKGFGKTLAGSAIFHALLFTLAFFVFGTESGRVFISPVYTVDLVPGPKGKDAGAARPEPAPAVKEQAPLPEAKQEAPAVKQSAPTVKIKEKPASIDNALKAISEKVQRRNDEEAVSSSIDDIRKRVEAKKEANAKLSKLREELSTSESRPAPTEAAMRAAKPGNAPARAGSTGGSLESKYPAYYGIIRDRVQQNWIYPPGTRESKTSVIISLKIARSGKILDASVEKSSGNTVFDESLLSAVWKASPFPPLPVEFEGNYLETGIRFCPGCQL